MASATAFAQLPPLKPPSAVPQFQTPQLKPQVAPQIQMPSLKSLGYAAETANAGFQGSANAGGIAWQCAAGRCSASGPATQPTVQACSELVRTVGAVRSFAYGQSALGPNELGQCNAAVASASKQGIGSMPHMGGLAPLPMMAAPITPGAAKESESDKPPGANVPDDRPVSGAALPAFKPALPATPMMSMPDLKPGPAIQQAIKPEVTLQAAPPTAPTGALPDLQPQPRVPPVAAPAAIVKPPARDGSVTTPEFTMTGTRAGPANVTTAEFTMTGTRAASRALTTAEFTMTGTRAASRALTTAEFTMTGTRAASRALTTAEFTMTGTRAASRELTTAEFTMTGTR